MAVELAATSMMRKAATNMTMPSALEISRRATLKPVTEIAADAGLPPWLIERYGEHVEARASAGAGFIYPICGDMRTMPGLTTHPAAEHMDIDADGRIVGLS